MKIRSQTMIVPKGLHQFDRDSGEVVKHYQHEPENPNSLSNSQINSIYEDDQGIFWLGTQNGLNRFDPESGTFTRYDEYSGLPNNVIQCIAPDRDGHLWVSTSKVFRNSILLKTPSETTTSTMVCRAIALIAVHAILPNRGNYCSAD